MKRLLYIPLSGLYTLGVAFRHMLYDQHALRSQTVSVPTICVGNLAVGGTGKTPMVEYIVRMLLQHNIRPAVLSRGYKRQTRGFVLADAESTAMTIGDESMQLHTKFPEVPIAVCENRVRGIKHLQQAVPDLDVVVLDDAFQHRAIRCGLNILLTAYDNLYIDDHMLPWGRLRDLQHRALKADAIVITKCPDSIRPIDMRVVDNRLHLPTFQQLYFAGLQYAPMEQPGNPLVVCGIAQPAYLLEHVRTLYPDAGEMIFADHHSYSPKDIAAILDKASRYDFVLTTEKDMQRLRLTSLGEQLRAQGKSLAVLPIEQHFLTDAQAFDRQLLTYIRENKRK